ncbi:protein of unknown function DUF820 [Gemmatirosa kalamazoonensis]|uniref:Putative restriction endonuclease domain-containing protein n=1 Tax=Gemmatirosa kalamazoonensis TaxID=861299 RepID=W0RBX4_9BACT|nr:Uma2 family endonuclease [Gemmatirosa kalamazoonensis]AHG87815.1 protein of unknown function DUF820 [Gemmatirosa kalamazoonensis]
METPRTTVVEPEPSYYTAEMVRALNEAEEGSTRYECVYGELFVTPGPGEPHQFTAGEIYSRLKQYVQAERLDAVVYFAPADITWGRDDVLVQPDVFVVPREMAREARRAGRFAPVHHLLLAIEVVSPNSRMRDRFAKRRLYQDRGVPTYWTADPSARTVEVWTPDAHFPRIERERLAWHPEGAGEPLVITLADLFAEP